MSRTEQPALRPDDGEPDEARDGAGPPPGDIAALLAAERRAPAPPDAMRVAVLAGVHKAIATGAVAVSAGATTGVAVGAAQGGLWLKGLLALAVAAGVAGGGVWVASRAQGPGARASTASASRAVHAAGASARAPDEEPVVPREVPAASAERAGEPGARAVNAAGEPGASAPGAASSAAAGAAGPSGASAPAQQQQQQQQQQQRGGAGAASARGTTGASSAAAASDESDPGLQRENDLLQVARDAMSRRDGAAVLAAVARHAQEFPRGQLAQERDALWVQGFALRGDADAAQARAERFRRMYPRSIFQPFVDAALGQTP